MGSNRVLRIKFQKPGLERRPAAALQVVSRTCVIKVLCGSWDRSAEPWPRPAVLLSGSQLTFWPNFKFSSKKFRLAWSWEKSPRKYRISKHFQEFRSNVPSLLLTPFLSKEQCQIWLRGWTEGRKRLQLTHQCDAAGSGKIKCTLSARKHHPSSHAQWLHMSTTDHRSTTSTLISLKKHHS